MGQRFAQPERTIEAALRRGHDIDYSASWAFECLVEGGPAVEPRPSLSARAQSRWSWGGT